MSQRDRRLRGLLAFVLLLGAGLVGFGTTNGLVLFGLAMAVAATAATGRCPLYRLYGYDSGDPQRLGCCARAPGGDCHR